MDDLSKRRAESSCPDVFCKKGVIRNFTKFTGKHLCQNLLFNKVTGPTLLAQVLYFELCEISRKTFFLIIPLVAASGRVC